MSKAKPQPKAEKKQEGKRSEPLADEELEAVAGGIAWGGPTMVDDTKLITETPNLATPNLNPGAVKLRPTGH